MTYTSSAAAQERSSVYQYRKSPRKLLILQKADRN